MSLCPCGSKKSLTECCETIIQGKQPAKTPEALMRSRYTAYALGDMEYIAETMRGEATKAFDPKSALEWSQNATWLGLEVIDAPSIKEDENVGFVEFIAHYIYNHKQQSVHERSEFHRENQCWYYVTGTPGRKKPQKAEKIGRNDACPCESGKKYKKCCGQ